jgi:hypothetical protein
MAVTQNIVTSNFNVHSAKQFLESFSEENGNEYFMFAGKHTPYTDDNVIATPTNSVQNSYIDVYDNMIFAKKIQSTDTAHVIPKNLWVTGTVYDAYDHEDADLSTKQFYVMVEEASDYRVHKCLFNNNGANSTASPTVDILPVQTSDGYLWKYMYTINKTNYEKFATSLYIPVIANTTIVNSAVPGTVEVVKITDGGAGYNNYITTGTFAAADLRVYGSDTAYAISSSASSIPDYYQGCVIRMKTGAAAGEYRIIISYVGNPKHIFVDKPFTSVIQSNDTYEIYPFVYIWGDGSDTKPAEAIAKVNPASANSIYEVEMLNVGAGYRSGLAFAGETPSTLPITVYSDYIKVPDAISGDTNYVAAVLRPIISPKGGHGSDPLNELFANKVCISTKFNQSESASITVENDFRQVGILKDPLYTNVELTLKNADTIGSFGIGDTVHQYKEIKLACNVSVSTSDSIITKSDYGKVSNTVTILNAGTGYDSAADTITVNNTGTGGSNFAAIFANNGSGVITSITVTNQGSNYDIPPTLAITSSTGTNGQLIVKLANPKNPTYKDCFSPGDNALINNGMDNYLATVEYVNTDYQIVATADSSFTSTSSEISALKYYASGVVTSIAYGTLVLSNVYGSFTHDGKIIDTTTGGTSVIESADSIRINDRTVSDFKTASQLYKLQGTNISDTFTADEYIYQTSLFAYATPHGYLHHVDTDNKIMYITNKYNNYDSNTINGNTSHATLTPITAKYPGDFVVGSGEVLYYENLNAISRNTNKSEIIKIILGF